MSPELSNIYMAHISLWFWFPPSLALPVEVEYPYPPMRAETRCTPETEGTIFFWIRYNPHSQPFHRSQMQLKPSARFPAGVTIEKQQWLAPPKNLARRILLIFLFFPTGHEIPLGDLSHSFILGLNNVYFLEH